MYAARGREHERDHHAQEDREGDAELACAVRLGADLACDVPAERFRLCLERLDGALPPLPFGFGV